MSLHGDHGAAWRRRQRRLRSWWRHEQQTVYGDPPFALQGGHRERRPTGREDSHQHQGGTCQILRTLFGRWQAHRGGSGQRHCLSRGRRGWGSVLRRASAGGCRAGNRCAQVLTRQDSAALGGLSSSAADGGPVGGCADCRVLFFAQAAFCRADR